MPDSKFKVFWNIVIIMLLMYTAIFVPYKIAFIENDPQPLVIFEWLVDLIFGIDIIVNFISATEDANSNTLIYSHKTLAANYIKSWFFLDVLACFPFQLFGDIVTQSFPAMKSTFGNKELLRLARLPRLYRLVRLLRMFKMVRLLRNNETLSTFFDLLSVHPAVLRLLKLVFVYFLYPVHIMGCIWFYVASFNNDPGCWASGQNLFEEGPDIQYLVSFYWSMQTITTVGFGDISISLLEEYILAIVWMVFGVSIYTICIGNVATIIATVDTKAAILSKKINTLQQYVLSISLSSETAMRIQKFLENDSKQANSLQE